MSLAAFGVRKPVVANLVMVAIALAGVLFGSGLQREFFPEIRANQVVVTAPYPGASPEEVEDALVIKIEDQLAELGEVDEIRGTASEGVATVLVELKDGIDIDDAVAEVKREVDALEDLPEGSERMIVSSLEPNLPAIVLSLYGGNDERALKDAARLIRDDLRTLPGMGDVTVGGTRPSEISVEVRPSALLEHGLSLTEVSRRIRESMRELPGGSVRSETSNVAIRSIGVDERASAVREIVVKSAGPGQVLRVGEIAEVTEGFRDVPLISRLNGELAVNLTVFTEGDDDIVTMAELVKAYAQGRRGESISLTIGERLGSLLRRPGDTTPVSQRLRAYELGLSRSSESLPGTLVTTTDLARFVTGRLDLLTRNALSGGLLVFLTLVVLLNWRVSFWVAAGLLVSLAGTLVMMRFVGISLNLLSMFGLIVVIGILVDDAIVVAENITARHEAGEPALKAAIGGTGQVSWPVVATVMTTVCAFVPLGLIGGTIGDFLRVLPWVVGCALVVSLVECLFILPSHMGHSLRSSDKRHAEHREGFLSAIEHRADRFRVWIFGDVIGPRYRWLLERAVAAPYTTLLLAVAALTASMGMIVGGRLEFIFFEQDDAETVQVDIRMPIGTSLAESNRAAKRVERAIEQQPEVLSYFTTVGGRSSVDGSSQSSQATHLAQIVMELAPIEQRPPNRSSPAIRESIKRATGEIPGVKSVRYEDVGGGPSGAAFEYAIVGDDLDQINAAATELMARLGEYTGVNSIASDSEEGQRELRFTLRDGATELGFTRESLGQQIQGFAFGIEAFTYAGEREDVEVRVMLPKTERRSLAKLESMHVFTPDGRAVPLAEVAEIGEGRSYATIRRFDRRRTITVTADVDRETDANPEQIAQELVAARAEIEQAFGVTILERGRQEDVGDAFATLPLGFATAALLIYVILAWLFGSYFQPLVVMSAIPFAMIGLIWGHVLLGYAMTFLSLIGFVALAGIVVNDSLIFMEFYNEKRREGMTVRDAAVTAGVARLRAILLTTITTVLGLLPLMLEQSFQAQFLIPMAITIAFGLISATGIILIVLPCLLMILQDLKRGATLVLKGRLPTPEEEIYRDPAEEVEDVFTPGVTETVG